MLVSTIIASGRALADAPGAGFYTDAEALRAVQNAYTDIYTRLTENNDDYFLTMVAPGSLTLTADTTWEHVYKYSLPADFYRLRVVKYKQGSRFVSVVKLSIEDFGNSQHWPGYRINGNQLWIYDPGYPNQYTLWYYPGPATLQTSTDLTYPVTVMWDILSYQVACEIRRKQQLDTTLLEQRKAEMMQTLVASIDRDDFKPQPIQNVFGTGGSPWR